MVTTSQDPAGADPADAAPHAFEAGEEAPGAARPLGRGASLVPERSIERRALVTIVAIMTFLAAVALGAVQLVAEASGEWRAGISREMTIQVRPGAGRDVEADVARAARIARETPGIAEARVFDRAESARLLEPWLGAGLALDDVPVPRMIALTLQPGRAPDLAALRRALGGVPGASLDDHRAWVDRLGAMAGSVVLVGTLVVALVLAATAIAVGFATTSAVASARDAVEVLHLVGAERGFIQREFGRHFLKVGLQGGAIGAGLAMLCFAAASAAGLLARGTPGGDQVEAMFGLGALGGAQVLASLAMGAVAAILTVAVSHRTVARTLSRLG